MVLVQILVSSVALNNNTEFVVPVSGKCSIRVLHVAFHHVEANTNSRNIQIRSDSLYFPWSPTRYITFITNPQANQAFDSGLVEYHLQNVVLQGKIGINVVQATGSALPDGEWSLLLTMQIEKINDEFNALTNTTHPSR
jgi:hypothetical protein